MGDRKSFFKVKDKKALSTRTEGFKYWNKKALSTGTRRL